MIFHITAENECERQRKYKRLDDWDEKMKVVTDELTEGRQRIRHKNQAVQALTRKLTG